MPTRIICIGKANTLSRQLRALQVMGCVPSGPRIVATDEPQPARDRGIARQPERKPGNAVTVQQSRSEPLPVPHETGSGTLLERLVRWSNSEPAVLVECAVLIVATLYCLVLSA